MTRRNKIKYRFVFIKILKNKDLNKYQIFDELNMKNIDIANIHFQGKAKKYLNNKAIKKYS